MDISKLKLAPVEFAKFDRQNAFLKKEYKLTRKNPFKTMNDLDWETYVHSHHPHFTDEPFYELIPWSQLQQLEKDAHAAGWELVLRTTNNTAYCPGHVGQDWSQQTQWIFGLPGYQFLIHLTYNENKWSLVKDTPEQDLEVRNYFCLTVVATTKLKIREKTYMEFDTDGEDLDYTTSNVEYYPLPTPATGWIRNGGMILKHGTSNFNYVFVGANAKFNSFLGTYVSNHAEDAGDVDGVKKQKQKNIMEHKIPASFWTEWIELNKGEIQRGRFDEVQITHWSDTYVLPGGQFDVEDIIGWDMDFHFLKQFMQSKIRNWIKRVYGYNCNEIIGCKYWNMNFSCWNMGPELIAKTCILEAQKPGKDRGRGMDRDRDEWEPFEGYNNSLLEYEDIRLSANAKYLIEQAWLFIKSKNE